VYFNEIRFPITSAMFASM